MSLKDLRIIAEGVNKEKNYTDDFLDDFNRTYLEIERGRAQEVPGGYYRPSSLAGGCKRMLFYQRTGAKIDELDLNDEWTYNVIGITESGTDRHTRIQAVINKMDELGLVEILDVNDIIEDARSMGINTDFVKYNEDRTEIRFKNDDLKLYFQADGIFRYKDKTVIFEIKTVNGFKFSKLKKSMKPLEEHIEQDTCYSLGLGIDYILYMYEDRNFTQKLMFLYKVTEEDKKKIIDKINDVEYNVKNNILPNREVDKCLYCKYKNICKE